MRAIRCLIPSVTVFLALGASASPDDGFREPCIERHPLRQPYFGDLHVHTQFSLDASTQGTRNRPDDAYRFARGEPLGIQPYGAADRPLRSVQIARPLDFAAVTDHAELLGEWNICNTPSLSGYGSLVCRSYRRWPRAAFFWMNFTAARAKRHGFCGEDGAVCLTASREPWAAIQDAAESAYDRSSACAFTSFVAYEWTGAVGPGNNFHRNVIFKNHVVPDLPVSFIDSPRLDQLWSRLRAECTEAPDGCDAVVIPHNSNLSGGTMFQTVRPDGGPITAEDARSRARFETLVEIMQHKGDSECMLGNGSEDELCGFEKLAMNSFSGRYLSYLAEPPVARQFVRGALKEGLAQDERLGVNPFQYGIVASTDTHLGTPGLVAENAAYPGHGGAGIPAADEIPKGLPDAIDFNPGGLAVLWAEENSRPALFEAMRRREAYGTSGPRIVVRFFGGWELEAGACASSNFAAAGYAQGVPMGAVLPLPARPGHGGPVFAVSALRDAGVEGRRGAPLQRIQIVKGWLAGEELHEKVYEVAGTPDNGAAVDLASCVPSGTGHDGLCSVWTDPDFDASQRSFYYARVLENPTCRWSQQLCNARGVRCDRPETITEGLEACCSPQHQPVIQERAWTSPIWYRPPRAQGD